MFVLYPRLFSVFLTVAMTTIWLFSNNVLDLWCLFHLMIYKLQRLCEPRTIQKQLLTRKESWASHHSFWYIQTVKSLDRKKSQERLRKRQQQLMNNFSFLHYFCIYHLWAVKSNWKLWCDAPVNNMSIRSFLLYFFHLELFETQIAFSSVLYFWPLNPSLFLTQRKSSTSK